MVRELNSISLPPHRLRAGELQLCLVAQSARAAYRPFYSIKLALHWPFANRSKLPGGELHSTDREVRVQV